MTSPGLEAHRPRSLAHVRDELRARLVIVNDQHGLLLCCIACPPLSRERQIELARKAGYLTMEALTLRRRLCAIDDAQPTKGDHA